jgi:hypothetical protein
MDPAGFVVAERRDGAPSCSLGFLPRAGGGGYALLWPAGLTRNEVPRREAGLTPIKRGKIEGSADASGARHGPALPL